MFKVKERDKNMELSKIENNVTNWLFEALYRDNGNLEEIYEMVVKVYNEEEDETKKERFRDSVKTLCKRLTIEDTMIEVNEALTEILNRVEGKKMKLSKMENKLGCWLFDAVYNSDVVLDEIVEIVLEKYNEEEDEDKKKRFKRGVVALRNWLIDEPIAKEVNYVLNELTNRL